MNVLYVTSEIAPFAKTGGLADVSAALPRHLARRGHDVRVFVPLYQRIDAAAHRLQPVTGLEELDFGLGAHAVRVSILRAPDAPIYFVRCPSCYDRPSIYTSDSDEHLRFLVLSRAALEYCQRVRFAPDVVHCHDWPTGLLPLTIKTSYGWDQLFARTKTLLTIHNLSYQGVFRAEVLADTGLAGSAHLFHQEQLKAGRVNFLLTGILYADGITTVSPTYAQEIQTPEHGAGLDAFLRARSSTVVGILNGVDYDEWSPENDRLIPFRYSVRDLHLKERNKQALADRVGLGYQRGVPLVGIVSRLASQKGFDLLPHVLPELLRTHDFQLVVLGSGEPRFEDMFFALARGFPRRVAFVAGFSNQLAHWIEAGSDLFLMPSRFEPCGLNQMYSLRYGTVPIVHKTGGLADTVELWNPHTGEGTGFYFERYDAAGLRWALEVALAAYHERAAWQRLMRNGMARDFSWDVRGPLYEEVYARL
ncbi:MAG TPA: glycogen synthase GlgA [Polyangia bacterium]|nr:glycogen synthase GlgA [Polyangia bacterium]